MSPEMLVCFRLSALGCFFEYGQFLFPVQDDPVTNFIGIPITPPAKWFAIETAYR